MTTRSTPASSIIGSARAIVNGSGNCGLVPGSQAQSDEFAFQKCTWASTIVRLLADCGRTFRTLVASAAPATIVVPKLRRVRMMASLLARFFNGFRCWQTVVSCGSAAKRSPDLPLDAAARQSTVHP
jgi:hypothetical protein